MSAAIVCFLSTGCVSIPRTDGPTVIQSPTLKAEFVHEMTIARKTLKPKHRIQTTDEQIRMSAETFAKHYPQFFAVTTEEEKRFNAGLYNNESNHVAVKVLLPNLQNLCQKHDTELPRMLIHLLHEHQQTPLHGPRLELLARMIEYMYWFIPRHDDKADLPIGPWLE